MSDFDTDIEYDDLRLNDYSDREEDNDEKKEDNNEEKVFKAYVRKLIKVNYHDGLSQREYDRLKNDKKEYKLSDCCQKYFNNEGYIHQNKFDLSIQDMTICIHCYISYSIKRFAECKDLTKNETDCLRYYIDNFAEKHNVEACQRIANYGKCLLCEAKIGIKPPIYKDEVIDESKKLENVKTDDINYISDNEMYDSEYEDDFVLSL